jgi:uncharacterized protein (TIGR02246 family)
MRKLTFGALLLLLFGCAQPTPAPSGIAPPVVDLKAQISANEAAWAAAANRGDVAAVAAMYTDTATMLPPGADIQKGRAAIEKTVGSIGRSGVRNFTLTTLDVEQLGPSAVREIGQFSLDAPGPKKKWVKVYGKYATVWKLVDGKWLLDVDIWNMNK